MWLTLAVAAIVGTFGLYRMSLALRKQDEATPKKGLYAMKSRTHALVGFVYLALAGALIATSFGWNPFGGAIGPDTATPSKDKAPTKVPLPQDQLRQP